MQLRSPLIKKRNANGAPGRGGAGGKLTFPKLIIDPVCHATEVLKSYFLRIFKKTIETKLVFNARKSSVGIGTLPTGERAQELCTSMPDRHSPGSFLDRQ